MPTRRDILKLGLLAAGCSILPFGKSGWVYAAPADAKNRLIVILMRGAVDGLSVVVPYTEANYYSSRPSIAIQRPGQDGGAIDLDGSFGLHPSLSSVMPLWQNKSLAFIHASGSPSETRSHFEAQDILETASIHDYSQPQGWLNGLVQQLPKTDSPLKAISIGNVQPKICMGKANIATISAGIKGRKNAQGINPKADKAVSELYQNNPELLNLYKEGTSSHEEIMSDLQNEMEASGKDAVRPDGFVNACTKLASIIKNDPRIQVAFLDVGGWDTHVRQGNAKGQLAGKLEKLGQGISTLASNLGSAYSNTTILVMSEFGRTVAENGNGGTDHGHGNVIWLMGGSVKGGKVWSKWPGLSTDNLYQRRDLAVTTDFREVISEILLNNFQMQPEQVAQVIRNYNPDGSLRGIV